MNQIEKIRKACIKANPGIVELKFGCVIKSHNIHELPPVCDPIVMKTDNGRYVVSSKQYGVVGDYAEKDFEIIGRPIRVADVLVALKGYGHYISIGWSIREGYGCWYVYEDETGGFVAKAEQMAWNLREDDLERQSEECLDFIASLL